MLTGPKRKSNAQGETLCVFVCLSIWVLLCAEAAPAWHDTAEFAAVGKLMTTSHSPGHPIYSILTGGVSLLPLGDVAFRAVCFSAICLVVSLLVLLRTSFILGADKRIALVWLGGCLLSAPVWIQGIRPEVYALNLCIFSSLCFLTAQWWKYGDLRWFFGLAFCFGLGGSNHSYLTLIPLPLVCLLLYRKRVGLAPLGIGFLMGLLGLLTYIFLPLRSSQTEYGWGAPQQTSDVLRMISASEWNKNLAPQGLNFTEQILELSTAFMTWLTPLGFFLFGAASCMALSFAILKRHKIGLMIFALSSSYVVFRGLLEVDAHNPDLMGYLAPGYMGLGLAICVIFGGSSKRFRLGLLMLGSVFMGLMLLRTEPMPASSTAGRYARTLLADAPADGTLILSNYSSWFWSWYLRGVEGLRPDLVVIFRGRVAEAWHAQRLETSFPQIRKSLDHYPQSFFHSSVRWEPGVELDNILRLGGLVPNGLTFGMPPESPASQVAQTFENAFASTDREDERYEAFIRYEWLRAAILLDRFDVFGPVHIQRLNALAGHDPLVRDLIERTRSKTP